MGFVMDTTNIVGGVHLVEIDFVQAFVQGVMTLVLAAAGSLILWRVYGTRIVSKAVVKHGADGLMNALEKMAADPENPTNEKLARAVGVQMAYMIRSIGSDLQSEEGREKYAPIFEFVWTFIQSSIYGTLGQIYKNLQKEGRALGDGAIGDIPPEAAGFLNHVLPKGLRDQGLDAGQLLKLASWVLPKLQSSGGSNGGAPSDGATSYGHSSKMSGNAWW